MTIRGIYTDTEESVGYHHDHVDMSKHHVLALLQSSLFHLFSARYDTIIVKHLDLHLGSRSIQK